jgi:rare lipoprotein A
MIYFSFFIFALLNGCSTHRKDGPPPYNVDVSKIPDAVPKVEQLSRIGNKSYIVKGKRYYVLNSSKNYEQRGIASWYGTAFHGRPASNGERYNMLAMTAAHKTLPLPTYVQVTNLKNGRKVIVKITDRGPFANDRLIDLSYTAAKKLGMLGRGTAPVDVKAIDPVRYARNSQNYHTTNNFFLSMNAQKNRIEAKNHTLHPSPYAIAHTTYIQVGAFRHKLHAEKLKYRLASVVSSPVSIIQLAHINKLYRVQIGPIKNAVTIAQIHRKLKLMGISSKEIVV